MEKIMVRVSYRVDVPRLNRRGNYPEKVVASSALTGPIVRRKPEPVFTKDEQYIQFCSLMVSLTTTVVFYISRIYNRLPFTIDNCGPAEQEILRSYTAVFCGVNMGLLYLAAMKLILENIAPAIKHKTPPKFDPRNIMDPKLRPPQRQEIKHANQVERKEMATQTIAQQLKNPWYKFW